MTARSLLGDVLPVAEIQVVSIFQVVLAISTLMAPPLLLLKMTARSLLGEILVLAEVSIYHLV